MLTEEQMFEELLPALGFSTEYICEKLQDEPDEALREVVQSVIVNTSIRPALVSGRFYLGVLSEDKKTLLMASELPVDAIPSRGLDLNFRLEKFQDGSSDLLLNTRCNEDFINMLAKNNEIEVMVLEQAIKALNNIKAQYLNMRGAPGLKLNKNTVIEDSQRDKANYKPAIAKKKGK